MIAVAGMDRPEALVARLGALAAVFAASGVGDVFWFDDTGAHYDDHGGNWAALAFAGAGRVVLFGYDHEYSQTVDADPPVDVLEDGPEWLPWARLGSLAAHNELGYCYWYDAEQCFKSDAAGDLPDGLVATAGDFLTDAGTEAELIDLGGYRDWANGTADESSRRQSLIEAAGRLLAACHRRALDSNVLSAIVEADPAPGPLNIAAGLAQAALAGLTAGSASPLHAPPAPSERRLPRKRRRLSEKQHKQRVFEAMRAASELERPPIPRSKDLESLVTWLQKNRLLEPGGSGMAMQISATCSSSDLRGLSFDAWKEVEALARKVRGAESDRERGAWLFLRIWPEAGSLRVERAFDHAPVWWYATQAGDWLWLSDLQHEMKARAPAWRPAWTQLLDQDITWESVC